VYEVPVATGQPDPLAPWTRPQRLRQLMQDMVQLELAKFGKMFTKLKDSSEDDRERTAMDQVMAGCQHFQTVLRNNQLFDFKELMKDQFKPNESPGADGGEGETPAGGGGGEQPANAEGPESGPNTGPIFSISRLIRLN